MNISFCFCEIASQEDNCWVMWSLHVQLSKNLPNDFPGWLHHVTSPPVSKGSPVSPRPGQHGAGCLFGILVVLMGVLRSHCGLTLHFLNG